MESFIYSPLYQAADFFNNLVPGHWPGFKKGTPIGDYWRYGYSNKTIFGDYWPDFKVSGFSNQSMGDYWKNMFGTDNMTNSNNTWY